MKLISTIWRLGILVLILAVIFHNFTARIVLTAVLRTALGAPVSIDSARIDLLNTDVLIRGVKIGNSYDFPNGMLANIPKVFIDLETSSLWEGRLHLETLEINLDELRVIRDPEGKVNLVSLRPLAGTPSESQYRSGNGNKEKGARPVQFHIDNLVLTMNRATYMDLTGPSPTVRNFSLRMNHAIYRNVDGVGDIVKIISWESLKRMGIGQLSTFLNGIDRDLGLSPGGPKGFLGKAFDSLKQKL